MDLVVSNLVNTMYCRDAGKKLRQPTEWSGARVFLQRLLHRLVISLTRIEKDHISLTLQRQNCPSHFDLAILGLGTREIAMALNDENAPVPSVYNREHKAYGKETTYTIAPVILWDSSRVWKILTAYVYTGAMVLGKVKDWFPARKSFALFQKGNNTLRKEPMKLSSAGKNLKSAACHKK